MARLGRFERPTSGSGDQRSIRAELQARGKTAPFYRMRLASGAVICQAGWYGLATRKAWDKQPGPQRPVQPTHPTESNAQPFAKSMMCLASFWISSAVWSMPRESTSLESVLATCFFSFAAKSYRRETSLRMFFWS
jgi:hypothetical protein